MLTDKWVNFGGSGTAQVVGAWIGGLVVGVAGMLGLAVFF